MYLQKGHCTVKFIRQRDTISFKARRLCSNARLHSLYEPNSGKFESVLAKLNSRATCPKFWFWWSPLRDFSFEEISKFTFVRIIQNVLAKQSLQGPGPEIKIASYAKNRYQTINRGHGDAFSYLILS